MTSPTAPQPPTAALGAEAGSKGQTLRMLTQYKAWANQITYETVMNLPPGDALRQRPTRFGNIVHTLNHIYVIDDIFRSHLRGETHSYTARNTEQTPGIDKLWLSVQRMDEWYVDYTEDLSDIQLDTVVEFEFVGGGRGAMTREQILLHIVNHGTYHRGFVGDMLYQIPFPSPANDLPVFLRNCQQIT